MYAEEYSPRESVEEAKDASAAVIQDSRATSEVNLVSYYENNAGRLVVDPACVYFGPYGGTEWLTIMSRKT